MNKFSLKLLLSFTSSLQLLASPGFASEAHSDRYPCLEDICIGDDLTKFSDIDWMSADKFLRNGKPPKSIGNPVNIKAFAPYWTSGQLDKKGINILSGIQGFCKPKRVNIFAASYLNKDRKLIVVNFGIKVSDDLKSQSFVVRNIFKLLYTGQVTESQKQDLAAQIKEKYPMYVTGKITESTARIHQSFGSNGLGVMLESPFTGIKALRDPGTDQMLSFPGCGGETKIKL